MRRAALIALLIAAACAPLDRRPPFGSAGYVGAVDAIGAAVRDTSIGRGQYVAGWARAKIEVPEGAPLGGYGDREGAPHTGTADDVYVRAFVIGAADHRALVFTADVLLVDPRIVEAVAARIGDRFDADRIFYTASHTHSGPGGYVPGILWSLALGPYDAAAYGAVVDAHVRAAEQALSDVGPATIGVATARAPGLIMNRTEKNGPVDDQMFVLRFERTDVRRVAAMWIYSCHAVTKPAENLLVSADYPGEVASQLEGKSLDLVAYAAGGVGSANPRYERKSAAWLTRPLTKTLQRALAVAAKNAKSEGRIASAKAHMRTPDFRYRVTDETMLVSSPIEALVDMPRSTIGALSIDDAVIAFMPAEISGVLTKSMRRDAREHGVELAVASFNGTYLGYVVPKRVYDLDPSLGEEMLYYETHIMTFFGPYGGDLMVNLGLRIARGVHARRR